MKHREGFRPFAPDPLRGIGLIDQAARSGDALSAYLAATIASTSFWRPCNWEVALDLLQQAAERGHDAAQSALAILATGPAASATAGRSCNELREAIDLEAWFTAPEPRLLCELAVRGKRTHTLLVYLNDDFSGGETHFPELGLSHVGAAGDAVVFSNVAADGTPDAATRHAGLPPTEGEKWLFSR